MAADPRGLDDLVAPLEGDDGAVRSPGALASADSDTVGVPIVELPEDRAAQAFGRRLAAEALAPMSRADRPPGFGEDRGVSSSRNPGRASRSRSRSPRGRPAASWGARAVRPSTPPEAFLAHELSTVRHACSCLNIGASALMRHLGHEPAYSAPFSALLSWIEEREALDHQVAREMSRLRSRQDALQAGLQGLRADLQAVDDQLQATIEVCLGVVAGLEAVVPVDAAGPSS